MKIKSLDFVCDVNDIFFKMSPTNVQVKSWFYFDAVKTFLKTYPY